MVPITTTAELWCLLCLAPLSSSSSQKTGFPWRSYLRVLSGTWRFSCLNLSANQGTTTDSRPHMKVLLSANSWQQNFHITPTCVFYFILQHYELLSIIQVLPIQVLSIMTVDCTPCCPWLYLVSTL